MKREAERPRRECWIAGTAGTGRRRLLRTVWNSTTHQLSSPSIQVHTPFQYIPIHTYSERAPWQSSTERGQRQPILSNTHCCRCNALTLLQAALSPPSRSWNALSLSITGPKVMDHRASVEVWALIEVRALIEVWAPFDV
jgi:hypothetical protein